MNSEQVCESVSSQKFVIKAEFNGDLRRVNLNALVCNDLIHRLSDAYALDCSCMSLKYKDEEGDIISIASDEELKDAYNVAQVQKTILRIFLAIKQQAASVPTVVSVSSSPSALPSMVDWRQNKQEFKAARRALKQRFIEAKASGTPISDEERAALRAQLQNARNEFRMLCQQRQATRGDQCKGRGRRHRCEKFKDSSSNSSSDEKSEKKGCRNEGRRNAWQVEKLRRKEEKLRAKQQKLILKEEKLMIKERCRNYPSKHHQHHGHRAGKYGCGSEVDRAAWKERSAQWREQRCEKREEWRALSPVERDAKREEMRQMRKHFHGAKCEGGMKAQWREQRCEKREEWRALSPAERDAKREEMRQMRKHCHGAKCEGGMKARDLNARFVRHVTINDGDSMGPNQKFTKTWRFRNEGTVAWPAGCSLVFIARHSGDNMGAVESIPVSQAAQPGEEVEISGEMISPANEGRYVGFWKLTTPEGRKFGQRVWVKINVVVVRQC